MGSFELLSRLATCIHDVDEEVFVLFTSKPRSQSLGMLAPRAAELEVEVYGRNYTIHQPLGFLHSNEEKGTTGAVVWAVTPLFLEWLARPQNILFETGVLSSRSVVVELGSGISGLTGLVLANTIHLCILTDQERVLTTTRKNLDENSDNSIQKSRPSSKKPKKKSIIASEKINENSVQTKVILAAFDWEDQRVEAILEALGKTCGPHNPSRVDVVLALDCVFNEYLVKPFVQACVKTCGLSSGYGAEHHTMCLIAQQLRSPDVFQLWLTEMMHSFDVWQMPYEYLTKELGESSGYVIHVAILKSTALSSS